MAITKVDTQGITVKANTKVVGTLQTLGNLEEKRAVTEYSCMDSNDTIKSLGTISRGSFSIGLLLDPSDATGQKELRNAFKNNTDVTLSLELPNGTTTGTTFSFTAKISGHSLGFPKDGAVPLDIIAEISSEITETAAV